MSPNTDLSHCVADLDLRDVVEDLRLLLDGSESDVDGITATAQPHPAFDPVGAVMGEGAFLLRLTDAQGRSRVAEIKVTARWREDGCWHLDTQEGPAGPECADCGTPTAPAGQMCQCEHVEHDAPTVAHRYLGVPAGRARAQHVGPVCDECARGHLAVYLLPTTGESPST